MATFYINQIESIIKVLFSSNFRFCSPPLPLLPTLAASTESAPWASPSSEPDTALPSPLSTHTQEPSMLMPELPSLLPLPTLVLLLLPQLLPLLWLLLWPLPLSTPLVQSAPRATSRYNSIKIWIISFKSNWTTKNLCIYIRSFTFKVQ